MAALGNTITKKAFAKFDSNAGMNNQLTGTGSRYVQWISSTPAITCAGLALFYCYASLPETCDSELAELQGRISVDPKKPCIGGLRRQTVTIILARFAEWTYVGSQQSVEAFFGYVLAGLVPATPQILARLR